MMTIKLWMQTADFHLNYWVLLPVYIMDLWTVLVSLWLTLERKRTWNTKSILFCLSVLLDFCTPSTELSADPFMLQSIASQKSIVLLLNITTLERVVLSSTKQKKKAKSAPCLILTCTIAQWQWNHLVFYWIYEFTVYSNSISNILYAISARY